MNPIGNELRRLREIAGRSTRDLAKRIFRSQSFVTKVERGEIMPSPDVVRLFTDALQISPEAKARLLCLSELVMEELNGLPRDPSGIRRKQIAIQRLEQLTVHRRVFTFSTIPGLLQTPNYAAHLYRLYGVADHNIDAVVGSRMSRSDILKDEARKFEFVISGVAINSKICNEEIMQEQINHIRRISKVHSIRILPITCSLAALVGSNFSISDDFLVSIEVVSGQFFVTQSRKIREYTDLFQQLFENSLSIDEYEKDPC